MKQLITRSIIRPNIKPLIKPAIISLFVIIASAWTVHLFKGKNSKLEPRNSDSPQEYMSEATLFKYTPSGLLKEQMAAESWTYYPIQQQSFLIKPHFIVYRRDNTVWEIDAERGSISQPTLASIDAIELMDEVKIERLKTSAVLPVVVKTDFIRYCPKLETLETDSDVTLNKPGLTVSGRGLRAFLDKGRMELLHDVKTSFETS